MHIDTQKVSRNSTICPVLLLSNKNDDLLAACENWNLHNIASSKDSVRQSSSELAICARIAVNVEPSKLGKRGGILRVRGCPPIAVIGNNNWHNERFTPGSLYRRGDLFRVVVDAASCRLISAARVSHQGRERGRDLPALCRPPSLSYPSERTPPVGELNRHLFSPRNAP